MRSQEQLEGRAIVYLRRSTDKQEDSLRQQLEWALKEATRRNLILDVTFEMLNKAEAAKQSNIGDLYLDNAITGGDLSRPGLQAFLERARTDSTVAHCMFWSRDRLARPEHAEAGLVFEKEILRSGKHVVTAAGVIAPLGRFENRIGEDIQMLLDYNTASEDRIKLAKNVLRAFSQNAKKGYWCGGRPPYGFVRALVSTDGSKPPELLPDGRTVNDDRFRVVVIPGTDDANQKRLEVARRIAFMYHDRLGGLSCIAKTLNAEGIPSPDAGRTRKGRPVPGKWTVSSVRCVIEQPLYMAQVCLGRRSEGCLFRYDADSATGYREATNDERGKDGKGGKKTVYRDYEHWTQSESPVKFDPIIPSDVWFRNYERLKKIGSQGTRGVPRCVDPNKYPLEVICSDCGKRMVGSPYSGRDCYVCSTYGNSHGTQCKHNWVERDIAVRFAVHALLQRITSGLERDEMAKAVKEVLKDNQVLARGTNERVQAVRDELARLNHERKAAYRDTIRTDAIHKADADEAYLELRDQTYVLERKLKELERMEDLSRVDIDGEVEKAMAILKELHLFLSDVADSRLRELFSALGARLTVSFEHHKTTAGEKRKRENFPIETELVFGSEGEIAFPAEVAEKAIPRVNSVLGKVGRGGGI
ncbi:MAG TPA: recombinase family protein [Planctomycetota bacterium]